MKVILFLFAFVSCADLTKEGSKVRMIETTGAAWEIQAFAEKFAAKNNCTYIGFVDSNTSVFPGSYSVHDNEIHSALRNRAAKIGANLVVADFYKKPAQGVGLLCPDNI